MTRRRGEALIAGRRDLRRGARASLGPRPVPGRARPHGLRARGLAPAARLPVPLDQPRLSRASMPPRDLHRREAQEGQTRTPARRRGRHHLRHVVRRGPRSRVCIDASTPASRHLPAARPRALSHARLLPRDRPHARRCTDGQARACTTTRPVAAAFFFRSPDTLYGRYWGARDRHHSLHFEACYHQGVEFCIERGLTGFEPGAQGEHKVSRGFVPATPGPRTSSWTRASARPSTTIWGAKAHPSTNTRARSRSTCRTGMRACARPVLTER